MAAPDGEQGSSDLQRDEMGSNSGAENLNFVNCAAQHSWRRLLHKETVMLGAIKATVVEKTARGA